LTATINASTSAGVVTTADTSGILQLQTNGTAALTVDASQNVGIGTSSPAYKVDVTGAIRATNTSNTTVASAGFDATTSWGLEITNASTTAGSGAGIYFLGGTNSESYIGNLYESSGAGALSFQTRVSGSRAERMRIDSSGNLLVGKTAVASGVNEKVGITTTTDIPSIYINPTYASLSSTIVYTNTTRAASAGFDFYGGYANSVGQFRVTGAGVIYAQNTSLQSISDQRLKENIRDSSDGLSVINGLRPVRYDWKAGYGNNQKNQLGFIAQEIETVFPEAVSEWQVDKNDETVYKTVGPGALIPVLVKAIQELKAINDTLTARIVALENR